MADFEVNGLVKMNRDSADGNLTWENEHGEPLVGFMALKNQSQVLVHALLVKFNTKKEGRLFGFGGQRYTPAVENQKNLIKEIEEVLAEIELTKLSRLNDNQSLIDLPPVTIQDILQWEQTFPEKGQFALKKTILSILNDSMCFNGKKFTRDDFETFGSDISTFQSSFLFVYRPEEAKASDKVIKDALKSEIEKQCPNAAARVLSAEKEKDEEAKIVVEANQNLVRKLVPDSQMSGEPMKAIVKQGEEEVNQQTLKKSVLEEFAMVKGWNSIFSMPSKFEDVQAGLAITVPSGTTVDLTNVDEEIKGDLPFGMNVKGGIYINEQYLESSSSAQMQLRRTVEGFELIGSKGDRIPNFSKDKSRNSTIPSGLEAEIIQYNSNGLVKSIESNNGLWSESDYRPEVVVVELNGQMYRITGKNIADIKSISFGEDGELLCGGNFGYGEHISSRQRVENLVIEKVDQTDEEIVLVEAKSSKVTEQKKLFTKLKRNGLTSVTKREEELDGKLLSKKVKIEKTVSPDSNASLSVDNLVIGWGKSLDSVEIGYFLEQDGVMRPIDISLRKRPLFDTEGNYLQETEALRVKVDGADAEFNNPTNKAIDNEKYIDMITINTIVGDSTPPAKFAKIPASVYITTEFNARSSTMPGTLIREITKYQVKLDSNAGLPDALYTLDRTIRDLQQITLPIGDGSTHNTFFTMSDKGLENIVLKSKSNASTAELKLSAHQKEDLKMGKAVTLESDWGQKFTLQYKDGKMVAIENLEV
jgi:hypothetical protein